ncbi:HAAS signaling domain-containing protein, partial [Couchioplanes caeruleus]
MTSGPYSDDTAPLAHSDVLVLDYLAALWAAGDDLDPDLRDELMTTVADYIAMRRAAGGEPADDPSLILRRLGAPEALAAAARRGRMPAHLRRPAPLPA